MIEWNGKDSLKEFINNNRIAVLEFGSVSCGACMALNYKLSSWIDENEEIAGLYISIDKYLKTAAEFEVFSAPAILIFVDGKLFVRKAGYFSLEQIKENISRIKKLM